MPYQPLPGSEHSEPRPVADSLDQVAARWGVPRARVLPVVFGSWPELVGPALAARTRACSLREGVLVVEVDDPVWATQLRWLEAQVLDRIAEEAGDGAVTSLVIRVRRP